MKQTISYSQKHPFKSVSCCQFPFCCSDKNQDTLRACNKKQGITLANLMLNRIVIVENTRTQFTYKVIRILCLSVLNDDSMVQVVHKICRCKYFHPWYILRAYSIFHQINENNNTLQPFYNTARYNTVLDITLFKDGSQKCIDYIEKWPYMVIFSI